MFFAHFRTWHAANFAFNWSDTIPRYRFVGPDRSAGLEHARSPGDPYPPNPLAGASSISRSFSTRAKDAKACRRGSLAGRYHCRDRASACRRRGCGGRSHRRPRRRYHYWSRSRRATLLSTATDSVPWVVPPSPMSSNRTSYWREFVP